MQCQICFKEFSLITYSHLKKHNISVSEYVSQYGEVASAEYKKKKSIASSGSNNPNYGKKMSAKTKEQISKKTKGRTAHNKGKLMSNAQKELLSIKSKERNKIWRETNSHPNTNNKHNNETKQKIKEARAKQVIKPESYKKGIETKKSNGYDFAFFKGKKHTQKTKEKISISSIEHNKKTSEESIRNSKKRLNEFGYTLKHINGIIFTIQCNTCNTEFTRTKQYASESKITTNMCPKCYPISSSNAEREIADFLAEYTTVFRSNRSMIAPLELDMFLPKENIAVEFNGLYWHSDIFKDKDYHINKTNMCKEKNIRLIHVFEDEWMQNSNIVKSRLLHAIGKNTSSRVYARKCIVKEISSTDANKFVNANHIQGTGRANVHIGLYYNNELISVMTFLNGDISKKLIGWELNRFCNKLNTSVVGGASKMFKYFINTFQPTKIISFADMRWATLSPVYTKLGFKFEHLTTPNYWYIHNNEVNRIHRFKLRKPNGCNISEKELRESEGYNRLYDCGSIKYVWENTNV